MKKTEVSIYWSILPILRKRADINLVVGQRSNGKTYGCLNYALEIFKKTKRRFCYIRRWEEDIKSFRSEQLFAPLQSVVVELFGADFTITYYRHKFYLVNPDGEKIDIIGYCVSLSGAAHYKSVSFANLKIIIFDEFIQQAGEATLRDEKLKYESILSTLIRQRTDIIIFCLANTVSRFSWLFIYYGISIDKVQQGDIVVKELPTDDNEQVLRVAVEYCAYNEAIGKKVSKYTTSDMIKKGKWEILQTSDIPEAKNSIVKERLLFSIHDTESDMIIGCFVRHEKWFTIENEPDIFLHRQKTHVREFLVLRYINYKSSYFHLSEQKALNYHTYNDITLMLDDIKDLTDFDFERELFMGRVYASDMFVADTFNHSYIEYGRVSARQLL